MTSWDDKRKPTCLCSLYFAHVTGFEKYLVEKMVEMKGLLHDVMGRQKETNLFMFTVFYSCYRVREIHSGTNSVMKRQKETNLRLDQLIKRGAVSPIKELPADIEFK